MVRQDGPAEKISLEPSEIGGELLDILSRGLYLDAKDALREYIQNSVDAEGDTVQVTIDGPGVTIRDNGVGMDFEQLRRARRLGASDKSPQFNVGFRGIGIYAAFGMCETLTIFTRQAGSDELLRLRMHFGPMSRALEVDRDSPQRIGIALSDLLFEHTDFQKTSYVGNPTDQFTMVLLDGLRPEYRSQLSKLSEVHSYLLNTLPVMLPGTGYGSQVNQWLRDDVQLNPIKIVLRVGKEPEVIVAPVLANQVQDPETLFVEDADGRKIGFMWYALTETGSQVSTDHGATNDSDVSGFLLKMKGFTLGNRTTLKHLWPLVGARALYHHYTGEFHILDGAGVVPNAARSDLEAGQDRDVLFLYLGDQFAELNSQADVARILRKIANDLSGLDDQAQQLSVRHNDPDDSPFEVYRLSKNFVETIVRTERELGRLKSRGSTKRGRTLPPSAVQLVRIDKMLDQIKRPKELANRILRATNIRTRSKESSGTREGESTPQAALLRRAVDAFNELEKSLPSEIFVDAKRALESALSVQLVAPAVAILDELKASGHSLSESLESSRQGLRAYLGWSPTAPSSLAEALAEEGFIPSTPREAEMIEVIDGGLRDGLGGRGEAYENLIRSISEALGRRLGIS